MVDLFIDSGAHSLYMQLMLKKDTFSEKEYDAYFEDYIKFVKENEKYITTYVNLDIINDPVRSMANYKKMRKEGLKPIAVVHPGEDYIWITKYLEMGCEYVGLGGLGQFFTKSKYINWADNVWEKALTDKKGMPLAKVHGFAMTSFDLMFRYPWYSVDSTTWVKIGCYGGILVPQYRKGWVYDMPPLNVSVSYQSPFAKEKGRHITTLSPMERNLIEEYLTFKKIKLGKSEYKQVEKGYKLEKGERWAGVDEIAAQENISIDEDISCVKQDLGENLLVETVIENGVCNDYKLRDEVNILYYIDLEKHFPKWPYALKLESSKTKIKGFGF